MRLYTPHSIEVLKEKMRGINIFNKWTSVHSIDNDLAKSKTWIDEYSRSRYYGSISGFRVSPGGLPYWGVGARDIDGYGRIIFIIVYWDGKNLRAYVSPAGDSWDYLKHDISRILADIDLRIAVRGAAQHNARTAEPEREPLDYLVNQPMRVLEL